MRIEFMLAGLLLLAPTASLAQAAPNGDQLFKQRCQMCHAQTASSALGPNLAGVVGRKAGSTSFRYSPALTKSGLVWTRPNLDKYLAAPMKIVPGTRMAIAVADPRQRAALIDYLAKLK